MSNLARYKDTWSEYRRAVAEAVAARDKALERVAGYEGERADAEREEAESEFGKAVGAAREAAKSEFNVALGGMVRRAESVSEVMEAPTEEQLRVLQMLSLRSNISQSEAEACAKALRGNDTCLETLRELCATRGGVIVREVATSKTQRQQALDAVEAFRDAANACLSWQGGTRAELLTERNRQGLQHVPEAERVPLGAVLSADIDPKNMSANEFVRVVCGNSANPEAASLVG